jgi:hypothetical protein
MTIVFPANFSENKSVSLHSGALGHFVVLCGGLSDETVGHSQEISDSVFAI